VEREERGGEGKNGREKERRGREWRVKTCCPMSNKLSPPMVYMYICKYYVCLI